MYQSTEESIFNKGGQMNENMKKIIELSDCEWIQEKKKEKIKEGDWIVWHNETTDEWSEVLPAILFDEPSLKINKGDKERLIWLPVGFDPKTGNLQVDDLLMEILNCNQLELAYWIGEKIEKLKWGSYEDHKTLFLGMPILKLKWFRELIEKENSDVK